MSSVVTLASGLILIPFRSKETHISYVGGLKFIELEKNGKITSLPQPKYMIARTKNAAVLVLLI